MQVAKSIARETGIVVSAIETSAPSTMSCMVLAVVFAIGSLNCDLPATFARKQRPHCYSWTSTFVKLRVRPSGNRVPRIVK